MYDRQGLSFRINDPVLILDSNKSRFGFVKRIGTHTITIFYDNRRMWTGSPDRVQKLSETEAMIWKLENA